MIKEALFLMGKKMERVKVLINRKIDEQMKKIQRNEYYSAMTQGF